jgi:hypothetical protein
LVEGATKALKGLLYKVQGSQPPLIKRKLIANKIQKFFHPFLTQVKSSYPIVAIQTYPKVAMSSATSSGLFLPTNIGRFSES